MAARTKFPLGSAPWIVTEQRDVNDIVVNEVEDFSYSVRNELEWLNEHMADIFKASQISADIFKTPGKLRGKTPRTARKREALGSRAPLTDIFAPNAQPSPSPKKNEFHKQTAHVQMAADQENVLPSGPAPFPAAMPNTRPPKQMTDSGYHGTTDDEMDIDAFSQPARDVTNHQKTTDCVDPVPAQSEPATTEPERRNTEETYVSAKSSFGSRKLSNEHLSGNNMQMINADVVMSNTQETTEPPSTAPLNSAPSVPSAQETSRPKMFQELDDDDLAVDGEPSSHEASPVQQVLRKSSLTFSALPAREPLVHNKSIGPQPGQRTSIVDQFKAALGRTSQLNRFTGGKSLSGSQPAAVSYEKDNEMDVDDTVRPELVREESETTRLHNKTSTQRLHERINMLGKAREVRPSKSIPFNTSINQHLYPQLPVTEPEVDERGHPEAENSAPLTSSKQDPPVVTEQRNDDEDDWIAPIQAVKTSTEALKTQLPFQEPIQPKDSIDEKRSIEDLENIAEQQVYNSPNKSPRKGLFSQRNNISTSVLVSPTKAAMAPDPSAQKPISVSNPNPSVESFTPIGSPTGKRMVDGPLSASKAKLYSVLRSAKGIFASSAGVSAQAKMEALSPPPPPRHQASREQLLSPRPEIMTAPVLYPNLRPEVVAEPEGRKTRSSTEREQRRKEEEARQRRKVEDELEKAREKERRKAAAHAAKHGASRPTSPTKSIRSVASSKDILVEADDAMPPPPPPKNLLPQASQQRLKETRRIAKPVKEQPVKAKPVTVRMPSQRAGHMPPATTAAMHAAQEPIPPPVPPKQPRLVSKPSTASLHASASTTSLKGTASSSSTQARKALEAAKKKKEEEAKAAERKAEQKRELEQKKLAKLEEERRLEQQRKAAEQARIQEAKKAAQRQAAETKRLEQQRKDAQRPPSRGQIQNDLASVLQQEKVQANQGHPRADLAAARPIAKMPLVPDHQRPIVQINPAKPPKRMLQLDPDEEQQPRHPIQRNPPSYQQLEAKRRKTNEEDENVAEERRSMMMAPPIRHSNIRKEPNKFPYSQISAQQQAHGQQSMLIRTVTQQHQLLHSKPSAPQADMSKFANARIPFADNPNPPAAVPSSYNQGPFKTPARPAPNASARAVPPQSAAKSSPHYPPGETINLPEIATDSEDEDSENEFSAPDWVNSPALRELLSQQQLVDPEQIFGPIAPLQMEEVFKNKDRQRKFRDRTSSAVWTNDRVTEEERRKDREARERLIRDGGWTFQPEQ